MKHAQAYAPDDGTQLLDDVRTFIARFVAFPSVAALNAVALWAVMTHMAAHLHTTPRLALLSPEAGSGKTRVLEVLALLVANSLLSFGASAASIFRTLARGLLTLLFDECDALFTKRGKDDQNEDLRALLNVGYRRGARIPRCIGPRHDVELFDVFAPAALAGLGDLPDTLMSRSIIVRMRRRMRSERVEQFRLRMHEAEGDALRDRIAAWAAEVGPTVGEAWPDLPSGVEDRAAECWEPLIAIADAAGGHWPETARASCVELLKVASEREVSLGVRLLGDLRLVFGDSDAMTTADILEQLNELDEAPWGDLYGKKMEPRLLARMLKRYDVRSTKVKVAGKSLQGYRREDLWDTWERYLAPVSGRPEPTEPHAPTGDARVPDDVAEVPLEVPLTAEVPHRPEPQRRAEPAARVPDDIRAEVPEVPLPQEEERSNVATEQPSLTNRALSLVDQFGTLPRVDVERTADKLLTEARSAPAWLRDTAKAEPLTVAVTLSLIAEDVRAGAVGTFPTYLAAARAAANGATQR